MQVEVLHESGCLQRLMDTIQRDTERQAPQQLSNTLWGCATLGYQPSAALMQGFILQSSRTLSAFKPQELSNTMLALAKLQHNPGELQPRWPGRGDMLVAQEGERKAGVQACHESQQ